MNQSKGGAESGLPLDVSTGASAPPTISIIIPTIGRPSLLNVLLELVPQLDSNDEVLVISAGQNKYTTEIVTQVVNHVTNGTIVTLIVGPPPQGIGNQQYNLGLLAATKDYIISKDDDDGVPLGSISAIKKAIIKYPNTPLLFFSQEWGEREGYFTQGTINGSAKRIELHHLGGPQLVYPNNRNNIILRKDIYAGDYYQIVNILNIYLNHIWIETIICDINKFSYENNLALKPIK